MMDPEFCAIPGECETPGTDLEAWPADQCLTGSGWHMQYPYFSAIKVECGSEGPQYLAGPDCDSLTFQPNYTALITDDHNCDDPDAAQCEFFCSDTERPTVTSCVPNGWYWPNSYGNYTKTTCIDGIGTKTYHKEDTCEDVGYASGARIDCESHDGSTCVPSTSNSTSRTKGYVFVALFALIVALASK